jgi:PleD family two-component response regulator
MMPTKLNLLLLEDSPGDAGLILDVLAKAGFDLVIRQADSQAAYLHALDPTPELILSDFSMPKFTALDALRLLQERGLEIPFIVVSGCIGEEMAVECMKAWATDYLMKDRLAEQRLLLETYHDSLTGLPNRALFLDRLDRVYQQSRRQPSHLFALLYLNLDAFYVVRDSVGPAVADRLRI